ncbi:hypothetical protein PHYPSEUDO_010153 [Phytophthora pseudosyringae]|uniref:Uncharacterized protein n=1 Tax=Phytophthora pseudosyringae TaxID=221518 RepID=A0A8T1VAR8_9STRA|nr:hypothetical protein PHYPSEUDO_010153 [Phytophthora pseudosyringae]
MFTRFCFVDRGRGMTGMGMDEYLDDMETMRRQLCNMNEIISDVKVVLQGVAYDYGGVVRMFDKDVHDGNTPFLSDVLNTLRSEAELDKQRGKSTKEEREAFRYCEDRSSATTSTTSARWQWW